MDILSQLGSNFMGNMGNMATGIENIPGNVEANVGALFGQQPGWQVPSGSFVQSQSAGQLPPSPNFQKAGRPPIDTNRLKMAMLLGGLGGGMGGGMGGGNMQQLLPLLMLMQQMQGGGQGGMP